MFRGLKPLSLLSGVSIILAVCIWPIICYNFVLNSIQLLVSTFSIAETEENNNETEISIIALSITMYSAMLIGEAIMVICLVIQFMSSLDYLTGNGEEFAVNWWKCHKKVLLLTGIVVAIKLCVTFVSINSADAAESSEVLTDSVLELYALAIDFIFLCIAMNIAILNLIPAESQDLERRDSSAPQVINVHSFLEDLPPSYNEVEKGEVAKTDN